MARTKSNGTNTSTATIGFEAGTESSPELPLARVVAGFDFFHLRFAPVVLANPPFNDSDWFWEKKNAVGKGAVVPVKQPSSTSPNASAKQPAPPNS